jgi:hypothetical protein
MKNEAGSLDWTGRPFGRRAEALHLADNLGPFGTLDPQKTAFSSIMPPSLAQLQMSFLKLKGREGIRLR